jgi:Fe-S oxidoreductase
MPPKEKVVVAIHFESLQESLLAVVCAMEHHPTACELIDKIILDCTKENIEQRKNRSFIDGDPEAVLCVEFHDQQKDGAYTRANALIDALKTAGFGYHYPIIYGAETKKVWDLRKAGLGLLANIPGDKKAVANIEDTAVDVQELPDYIAEFTAMMQRYNQQSVYYAHAGAGELHLRPLLNLKDPQDRKMFRKIAEETALLVKKYKGSLSGEHGDGRVRGEFIPWMIGEENYELLKELKATFDPYCIINPGKITDTPPMDKYLRYDDGQHTHEYPETIFDFSSYGGILRLAEKCNGSGDCRKTHLSGGTLCPSYMATRDEKDTTRARANILRTLLTNPNQINAFDSKAVKEVLDLCISCKGCTSECPSNVDMASLKAEFSYQYHKDHIPNLRSAVFGHIGTLSNIAMVMPRISNFLLENKFTSSVLKKVLSVASERHIPTYYRETLIDWWHKNHEKYAKDTHSSVILFADEFTNYNDVNVGIIASKLLYKLGFNVQIVKHRESGRAMLSKGWVADAQACAIANVSIFKDIVSKDVPLLGIEPSAILTFRDEYLKLVPPSLQDAAKSIAKHTYTVEEFLYQKISEGIIRPEFTEENKKVLLHGHCHQKALSNVGSTAFLLSLPQNYAVETIASGCCGMAGSFGYEKEHFEVSKSISDLVLIPKIKHENNEDCIVAAPGTSCRHQIADFGNTTSLHPIEVFYHALK